MAPDSFFVPLPDGGYQATELTRGPWSPLHQHGGPPSALLAWAFERQAAPLDLTHIARLTVNFLRPIPIAPMTVSVTTDRAGRKAAYLSGSLSSDGLEIARATALVIREQPVALPDDIPGGHVAVAPNPFASAELVEFPFFTGDLGYHKGMETRLAEGAFCAGPCAVWFRARFPLIPGETLSPMQRVALAADSGNGISMVLDFARYTFVNPDLTVHLLRKPVGEWICLDARTYFGPNGLGMAEGRLFDETGLVGRSAQSLVVEARK